MSHTPEIIEYDRSRSMFRAGLFALDCSVAADVDFHLDDYDLSPNGGNADYEGTEIGIMEKLRPEYDCERELYSMWQAEAFNLNGMPCTYHVLTFDTQYDPLFGEDNNKRVERAFPVMLYCPETPENNRIWTVFGPEGVNDLIFYVNKEHFEETSQCGMPNDYPDGSADNAMYPTDWTRNHQPAMQQSGTKISAGTMDADRFSDTFDIGRPLKSYIPKVGDVFVLEYDQKSVYEVKRVREEEEMFLQHKHCWVLETTKTYINEHIDLNKTGAQPTNYVDPELEWLVPQAELYDDRQAAEIAKQSTEVVPPTFPTTTGKGKPNPFYTPTNGEAPPQDMFAGF